MKPLENNYKGKIEAIENSLTKQDKIDLENWLRKRRGKAGEDKCGHYKTNLLALREVAQKPFSEFKNNELIENLLIEIKNSSRELGGRNELRKTLKNFLKWKFQNISIKKLNGLLDFKLEKQPPYNKKKYNKSTQPTDEEIQKMFLGMNNLKDKAIFTIQEELGLPPAVILTSKIKQWVDCESHYEFLAERTKNNENIILILKTGYIHLKRYFNEYQYSDKRTDDWTFPNDYDRTKPINNHYIADLYRRVCKKQGIRNITAYQIRRRRLMAIYKKTGDLELTAKCGLHTIEVAQKVYHNFDGDDIKDMIMERIYDVKEPTQEEKTQIEKLKTEFKEFKIQSEHEAKETHETLNLILKAILTNNKKELQAIKQAFE